MTPGTKKAALSVGVVVLLIGAFFFGRATSQDQKDGGNQVAPTTVSLRSEEGAVEAAGAIARILPGPSGSVDSYYQAMSDLAAPEWQSRAEELAQNAVAFVTDRYGEGGGISFEPIRYRVLSYSPNEAEIDIWGVALATSSEGPTIEESWLTASLSLVWLDGQWKLNGQDSQGGPTPELLKASDEASGEQLSGFEEYEGVDTP